MANGNEAASPGVAPGPSRWRQPRWQGWPMRLGLAALVLLAAALGAGWHVLSLRYGLATAYAARIACSCRYVAGRDLSDCRHDFEPGMGLVMLSDDAATRTITARVPLLAHDSATWRREPGCQLRGWRS